VLAIIDELTRKSISEELKVRLIINKTMDEKEDKKMEFE